MSLQIRLQQIRNKIKEKKYSEIFSRPTEFFYLIILVLRFSFLRLIPRVTKMYFIQSKLYVIEKAIVVKELEYSYRVFEIITNEIEEYILNRCKETGNMIPNQYTLIISKRFSAGIKAHSLLKNGSIVAICFASNNSVFIDQVDYLYIPAEKELVITDIYTLRNFRKRGLYLMLLKKTISLVKEDGYEWITMWVMKHNNATINAQIKAGFCEIFKTVTMFSWFGFKLKSVNSSVKTLETLL